MSANRPAARLQLIAATIALLAFTQACKPQAGALAQTKKIEPVYNQKSGRLEELKYDSDGDGRFDTFSYMDGATILRIEIDQNEDGKIDRWEYYGPGKVLERVGFSRAQNGVEDVWQYFDHAGAITRVEMASTRGKNGALIDRIEYYEHGVLTRAEEDTDHDGTIDKWETYDGDRLAAVAFDDLHRGVPTRKLLYGADGSVRIEVNQSSAQQTTRQSQ
jgi:hypothetical protein